MVLEKPPHWKAFSFADKLKWYEFKDVAKKNVYSSKIKVKDKISEMNLDGLHYAKIIPYVLPIDLNTKKKLYISCNRLLMNLKYQLTDEKIARIFNEEAKCNTDAFNELLKNKYKVVCPDETPCQTPPTTYVIKLDRGWNTMAFVYNNKIIKIVAGIKTFKPRKENLHEWFQYIVRHNNKPFKPKLFIEEFIGDDLMVYQIYCIQGVPHILSLYYDTGDGDHYENNYSINYSINPSTHSLHTLNLLPPSVRIINKSSAFDFKINKNICHTICNYAKEFASLFEFVRVDFYYKNHNIYFSECTFKPYAFKKKEWGYVGNCLSSKWD